LAQNIIKSCCILHNCVRARDGYRYDDTLTVQGLENIENTNMTRGSQTAQTVKDKYANYFVTDGVGVKRDFWNMILLADPYTILCT